MSECASITPKPICFDNAEALLSNPDRGLRMETYITLGDPPYAFPTEKEDPFERANAMILKYREDSPTLCQLYVYLSNYTSSALDSTAFKQLKEILELFKSRNIRLLLRFAYSVAGIPDAKYKTVRTHLEQIKRFFFENSELINSTLYCIQTGIIGFWGEGHSNKRLKNRYKKRVINHVCDIAPEGIYTQVRTYDMLKLVNPENKLKVGIHDDYIIGNTAHKWAFVPSSKEKEYENTMRLSKRTVNDGEMPWGRATLDDKPGSEPLDNLDGISVLKQIQAYSLTSFSLEHNYREEDTDYSLAKWKQQYLSYDNALRLGFTLNPYLFKNKSGESISLSVYDILRYHLGYQLMLSDCYENNCEFSFKITNYGFAAPLNFNYLAVVAKNATTNQLVEQEIKDYNKTSLQSGASVIYKTAIPPDCKAIGIKMDKFKGRGINPRFANDTPFDSGIQYFV